MRISIYLLIFFFGFFGYSQAIEKDIILPKVTIKNNQKIDSILKELNYFNESNITFYLFFRVDLKGEVIDYKIRGENKELSVGVTSYFFNHYKEIVDKLPLSNRDKYTLRVVVELSE